MRLSKIRVKNFRAIGDVSLDLDPKLTVLVGDNAVGKTSLIEAIGVFLSPALERCPRVAGADLHWEDIRRVADRAMPYAYVRGETEDHLVWDRQTLRDEGAVTRKRFHAAEQPIGRRALYEYLDPIIAARAGGMNEPALPVIVSYGTDRAVVWPPLRRRNFREEQDPFEALRNAFWPTASFKAMFEWFLAVETEELREQRKNPKWVHPQLEAVRKSVTTVIPGCTRLEVATRPLRLEVALKGPGGEEETLSLLELSGGYRTLLALVADLARRMAQANPTQGTDSEAIVLIDEVDLHLHPKWQQTVLDDLRRAFPNAQFIVSTHSEQVIASVLPEQVVRLERDSERGVVLSSPTSTYGATPDRVSMDVMGVPTLRRANVAGAVANYWALIGEGKGESADGLKLRGDLDGWFRGQDPELVRADAEIHRQKMLARLRGGGG